MEKHTPCNEDDECEGLRDIRALLKDLAHKLEDNTKSFQVAFPNGDIEGHRRYHETILQILIATSPQTAGQKINELLFSSRGSTFAAGTFILEEYNG